jgi:hypothetical protein
MKSFSFDAIAEKRQYGSVIGGFTNALPEISEFENLNRASQACNVYQIGDDWIPISHAELLSGLANLIGYDSAYGMQVVPAELANQAAQDFASVFESDARFYRNFEHEYDGTGRFTGGYSNPLTDATFSYGFAGLDSIRAGMIVVCDED